VPANGASALYVNTTGYYNTASGVNALRANTTGLGNTGDGVSALQFNTTGDYNIDIGHAGVAGEGNTIRLGTAANQSKTFIAGIYGAWTGVANAVPVMIDSSGQVGTGSSSRRVKDGITDMADASSGLMTLRPVTFYYTFDHDPAGRTLQYGLIAEEVAEVYPGLVAHTADGQIETVKYQFLAPMLLNEFQKQQRTINALHERVRTLESQGQAVNDELRAANAALTMQLAAVMERLAKLEQERR